MTADMESNRITEEKLPSFERGNAARKFNPQSRVRTTLPVIAQDGTATRQLVLTRRHPHPVPHPTSTTPCLPYLAGDGKSSHTPRDKQHQLQHPSLPPVSRGKRKADATTAIITTTPTTTNTTTDPASKRRKKKDSLRQQAEKYSAQLDHFEMAKAQIARMASAVVADPQANVGRLKDLRKMAQSPNRAITALILLTESQLYKDICPAYRIRPISDEEATTKVSKDIAQLRNFEQALLSSYSRFVESAISLSRWHPGKHRSTTGPPQSPRIPIDMSARSDAERKMIKVRRAACTSLVEVARALLHFNLAEKLGPAVAALATDREPEVRSEAERALSEIFGEAHRCSGHSLKSRVAIAESLSRAIITRKSSAPPEALRPFLAIRFPLFARFSSSDQSKTVAPKRFNRKHRRKPAGPQAAQDVFEAAEMEKREQMDLERDLHEAQAEASPQELFEAKKQMLNSVCLAYFNVIKSSSEAAISADSARREVSDISNNLGRRGKASDISHRTRKPPQALSEALEGVLQVAFFLNGELLDAILAALNPLLEGDRLPLLIRFRCLTAAYSILSSNSRSKDVDSESFTRDCRSLDYCLYSALGHLYGQSTPLSADESVTHEALRAASAALCGRRIPRVRSSAFARRLGIIAAARAPTHACAVGLVGCMQKFLSIDLIEGLGVSTESSAGNQAKFGVEMSALDTFDQDIDDPDIAGAEHCAPWEILALLVHFHPSVCQLAAACWQGNVGDAMPSSSTDPASLLAAHSSASGGFYPSPKSVFNGRKRGSGKGRTPVCQSSDGVLVPIQDDVRFPESTFIKIWQSSVA